MAGNLPILYLVIPCYNEEEILLDTAQKLKTKLKSLQDAEKISSQSKICFVNDGSRDNTWSMIKDLSLQDPDIYSGICLAHNQGQQNALTAGLLTVKDICDITVSLDADLQDDMDAIDAMVDKYNGEGCNIVYGVRNNRDTDTFFKRFTAELFYKTMSFMGANIIFNHADFRLMDRRALDIFAQYQEVNLFVRGIVPMIGLKNDCVYYKRQERLAGESKYPLSKLLALAWQGITSLSIKPIRFISALGIAIAIFSIVILLYSLISHYRGNTIVGWTSIMASVWFIGGLNIFSIGIIGEYVGKIYLESKHRPRFAVSEFIDQNKVCE
ncbi:MAG: glycosyltransferase family 2 protein [bacterium]|nr:glycosyltransferase family 2 protein [bacterium]